MVYDAPIAGVCMGKLQVITEDRAARLLEEFRACPGSATLAARKAGFNYRTAKKAWEVGLMSCPNPQYHRPFKDIVLEEQREIRARIQREEKEASALVVTAEASRRQGVAAEVLTDVTKQRTQEEQLVRSARAATIVLLSNVTTMAAGATALGQKVRQSLEKHAKSEGDLSINQTKDVVSLVGRLATSLRQLNDAGQKAMEMSRLLAGEPTSILGIQHLTDISVEEARQRMEAADRALAEVEVDDTVVDAELEPAAGVH